MEIFAEIKEIGDAYAGGFSCGLTMGNSGTMGRFLKQEETQESVTYSGTDGCVLRVKKTPDNDALRVQTSFTNGSDRVIELEMITSFAIRDIDADLVHRLQSCWSAEGRLRTESVTDLHMEVSWNRCAMRVEKFGNMGSMPVRKYFPFVALENSKTGHVIGVQLYSPSSWQMEIRCKDSEKLTLTGGIADRDFGHWTKKLAPGETFYAPEAVIARGESLYEVCDKLVKAQHPMISPVDDHMGILFNEYCTTWGHPTIENLKRIADRIADKGIQYLVIDSGWYGTADAWWDQIGDWDVNEKRFPNGMKEVADYIRSKGMIPGLWYELESVTHASRYFNATEHLLQKDGVPLTVGNRRFWDMEDPWVIDYLSDKVIRLLKECGFGYLKVDYNDTIGTGCDGAESLGEALRRKVLATQRFFEKIRREIPGILIENCSSGGHRLEPSMMQLCSQASFSDAHEIPSIPLIAANLHRVIRPDQSQIWAVLRAGDSEDRLHYSVINTFFGRMCLSGDIYELSEAQWKIVEEGMEFYRKASDIIQNGRTILQQYSTASYNDPTGEQIVLREWGMRGLAIVHRFADSKAVGVPVPAGAKILAEYGSAGNDFSAKAWIYEKQ